MRAVVQRVLAASVEVDKKVVGSIDHGLLVYLGVGDGDSETDLKWLADKIVTLRIFADDGGKFNLSLTDIGGGMLVISQFTLFGDCRKGRRPSFTSAAEPARAEELYQNFIDYITSLKISTAAGIFGADMKVNSINDGPVTMLVDSKKLF